MPGGAFSTSRAPTAAPELRVHLVKEDALVQRIQGTRDTRAAWRSKSTPARRPVGLKRSSDVDDLTVLFVDSGIPTLE